MGFPKRRDFKIPPLHSEGKKMSPPKDLRALPCHRETVDRGRLRAKSFQKEVWGCYWVGRGGRGRLPTWPGLLVGSTRRKWSRISSQQSTQRCKHDQNRQSEWLPKDEILAWESTNRFHEERRSYEQINLEIALFNIVKCLLYCNTANKLFDSPRRG